MNLTSTGTEGQTPDGDGSGEDAADISDSDPDAAPANAEQDGDGILNDTSETEEDAVGGVGSESETSDDGESAEDSSCPDDASESEGEATGGADDAEEPQTGVNLPSNGPEAEVDSLSDDGTNGASECTHENRVPVEEAHFERDEGAQVKPADVHGHQILGEWVTPWTCPDCGETGEDRVPGDNWEEHAYNETGYCSICDYQCPHEGGTHPGREWNETKNPRYYNEDEHTIERFYYVEAICDDCSAVFREDVDGPHEEYEGHIFVTNSATGKVECETCGYTAACEHPENRRETVSFVEPDFNYDGDPVIRTGADGHTVHARRIEQTRCADCGVWFDWRILEGDIEATLPHDWEDGKCWCGAENGCDHSDTFEDTWRESVSDEGIQVDGKVHERQFKDHTAIICLKCGEILNEIEGKTYSEMEDHDFRSVEGGKVSCQVCGYTVPCEHPAEYVRPNSWTELDGSRQNVVIDKGDLSGHKVYTQNVEMQYCDKCDTAWDWKIVGYGEGVFPHDWDENGVCTLCGYESDCTHPNKTENEWTERLDDTAEYLNDREHTVDFQVHHETVCEDCGRVLESSVDDPYPETNSHEFNENAEGKLVCWLCDYVSTCDHPADYVIDDEWIEPDYDLENPVISSDENGHEVIGRRVAQKHCMKCGAYWDWHVIERNVPIEGEHEFELDGNGGSSCRICGWLNQCTHEETVPTGERWEARTDKPAEQYSEDEHAIEFVPHIEMRCVNCGVTFEEEGEPYDAYEGHSFMTNEAGEVACEFCGYVFEGCNHPMDRRETFTGIEPDSNIDGDPVIDKDASGHTVYARKVEETRCAECGIWFDWHVIEDGLVAKLDHEWQDGVCMVCGYENGCEHEHKVVDTWQETISEKAIPVDGDVHEVQVQDHTNTYCEDCGEYLGETIGKPYTTTEDHFFQEDEDGKVSCQVCGYTIPCEHPAEFRWTQNWIELDDARENMVVDQGDVSGHMVYTRRLEMQHCDKCGYVWGWNIVGYGVDKLPHDWDEDGKVCTLCGFESDCTHQNTTENEWTERLDDTAKQLNDREHTVSYQDCYEKVCKDCGYVLESSESVPYTDTEYHEFNENAEGKLVCWLCGYVSTCDHPADRVVDDTWTEPDYDLENPVISSDANGHKVTGRIVTQKHCLKCDAYWDWHVVEENVTIEGEHEFEWDENGENRCWICGWLNECEHEWAPSDDRWYEPYGDPIYRDAVGHTVQYAEYGYMDCTKCHARTEEPDFIPGGDTFEETSVHYFGTEDGRIFCHACGYEIQCSHPEAYVETVTEEYPKGDDENGLVADENTHHLYGVAETHKHCNKCGADWDFEELPQEVVIEGPHEWLCGDGYAFCSVCGYEKVCEHEFEEYREEGFDLVLNLTDERTHSKVPYTLVGRQCKKCGAIMIDTVEQDLKNVIAEAHKFEREGDNDVCEICGYIQPVEPPVEQEKPGQQKPVEPPAEQEKPGQEKPVEPPVEQEEPEQEKTEESAFERIADGAVVHGVTVGQPTRMGVTMVQAMAGIVSEYGSGVEVAIQNIDKVLTADECAALNALQPTERILVALSAIGYGDEVNNAIAELQLTLSEAAQELNQQVSTRVALMDDAAKAAHQKAIERYFPNANGVAVTLEIRQTGESGARLERYGFTQSNGGWVFAKLEVADN